MGDVGDGKKSTAEVRLKQVSDQLKTPASQRQIRQKTKKASELPADWSDVLAEIDKVRRLGETPKSESTGYKRHKAADKLWVRERLELLLDKGSFREVGSLAGTVNWIYPDGPKHNVIEEEKQVVGSFTPSNNVQGFGKLGGRTVILSADDFTIRAGHADGALMPKTVYMDKMSVHLKIPKVNLVDGASGGGSITSESSPKPVPGPPEHGCVYSETVSRLCQISGLPDTGLEY